MNRLAGMRLVFPLERSPTQSRHHRICEPSLADSIISRVRQVQTTPPRLRALPTLRAGRSPSQRGESVWPDSEIERDFLNFCGVADTVAGNERSASAPIDVSGAWVSAIIANQIHARVVGPAEARRGPCRIHLCRINAWLCRVPLSQEDERRDLVRLSCRPSKLLVAFRVRREH